MKLEQIGAVFPTVNGTTTDFSDSETDISTWEIAAIKNGQAYINQAIEGLFQPQELRFHQRGAVNYDKGCYLGQEIIARLWFKAKPKHWLHLIQGQGDTPQVADNLNNDVQVVNTIATENNVWLALVTAKPTALESIDVKVLDLPDDLNGDVARPQ